VIERMGKASCYCLNLAHDGLIVPLTWQLASRKRIQIKLG